MRASAAPLAFPNRALDKPSLASRIFAEPPPEEAGILGEARRRVGFDDPEGLTDFEEEPPFEMPAAYAEPPLEERRALQALGAEEVFA